MGVYDRSFTGNKEVYLAQKLMFAAQKLMFWGKWMQFTTPDGRVVDPNRLTPAVSNAPLVVHRELEKKQGDKIQVPMIRNLVNIPKYGDTQLSGQEEETKMNHCDVYLDMVRHANKVQDGSMMKQTTKDIDIAKRAKPLLERHYAEVSNFLQVPYAFYKGFSSNILGSNRFSSVVSTKSHPHIFVAGSGKVTYGTADYPGTANYEAAVATAIDGVGPTHVFDTELLTGLRNEDQIRMIPYLYTEEGMQYRIIVAHHYQLASLIKDPDFRSVMNAALGGAEKLAKKNPYLVGCKYLWEDWAIFDGGNGVFPVSTSSSLPVYGPTTVSDLTSFQDYSSYDKFAAIVIGDNAMAKATGSGMEFISEERDYREIVGIGYRILEGWARPDYWNRDDGTLGATIKNDTSAIVITSAAKPTY